MRADRQSSRAWRRLKAAWDDPLLRGAYSLMLNTVATSGLGLIFWIVAARTESSREVGLDSALIVSMMALSSICQLNLANAIPRFLPQAGPRAPRWVLSSYGAAVAVTAVGGVGFVVLAPLVSSHLRFLRDDGVLAVVFVAATTVWSIFALQDSVLTALRRTPWVPAENALFGVLKLILLPVFAALGVAHGVFVAWILPMAALVVPVNWFVFVNFLRRYTEEHPVGRPVRQSFRRGRLAPFLAQDYVGSVFNQAVAALPPLLVVALLGSSANAYFYIPFTLLISFDTVFSTASMSLVVEGAFGGEQLSDLVRRSTRQFAKLLLPGTAVLVAVAPVLLLPFGSRYASGGTSVLRILACGSVFRAIIVLMTAVWRLEGHGLRILLVYGLLLVVLLPLSYVLSGTLHADGVALAWLVANAGVAALALPSLVRLLRKGGPRTGLSPAPGLERVDDR